MLLILFMCVIVKPYWLLATEDIDVIFLTEINIKNIEKEEDYQITGYKTNYPSKQQIPNK